MTDPAENLTEQPQDKPANPKPRRKAKRRAAGTKVVPFQAPEEFAGMTATDCCNDCTPVKCVISGIGYCAHPLKSGLQSSLMGNQQVMARYGRAKRALQHQKVDVSGG